MAANNLNVQLRNTLASLANVTAAQTAQGTAWSSVSPVGEIGGMMNINFGVTGAGALSFTITIKVGGTIATVTVQKAVGGAINVGGVWANDPNFKLHPFVVAVLLSRFQILLIRNM
jgi:hypothetical protein